MPRPQYARSPDWQAHFHSHAPHGVENFSVPTGGHVRERRVVHFSPAMPNAPFPDRPRSALTTVGVFYDGNYFNHVSTYYKYSHPRHARLSIAGLHRFIRAQIAGAEPEDPPNPRRGRTARRPAGRRGLRDETERMRRCQIVEAHYFRGRLAALEAAAKDSLLNERLFEDVLMKEGRHHPFAAAGASARPQPRGKGAGRVVRARSLRVDAAQTLRRDRARGLRPRLPAARAQAQRPGQRGDGARLGFHPHRRDGRRTPDGDEHRPARRGDLPAGDAGDHRIRRAGRSAHQRLVRRRQRARPRRRRAPSGRRAGGSLSDGADAPRDRCPTAARRTRARSRR